MRAFVRLSRCIALQLAALVLCACGGSVPIAERPDSDRAREEVLVRFESYMVASRAVDADAIASFYSPTGTLFEPGIEPVVSADAIRGFIRSFPGVKVEVATATADRVDVYGDVVYIWGSYHERLAFPGQPLSEQDGKFVMEWRRGRDGQWLVERLFRVPLPPKTTAATS